MKKRREDALQRALNAKGTLIALAKELNITPEAVCNWRRVPVARVLAVEKITGVPRWELRPDIYPPPASESM